MPVKKTADKKKRGFTKEDEKRIEKELEEIYQNGDGTMPDMADFTQTKRSRLTAFLFLLFSLLFLGAVAWAGFFLFSPQSRFNEADLNLSVTGEEQIMAGQEVRYRIHYRNNQNVPLSRAVLQIRYPDGFVFSSASKTPSSDKNDEWILGAVDERDSGYLDIFGRLYGDLGKRQSFRVFLNYFPANFSSEFQKVASLNTEITGSPVNFSVSGPREIVPGAEVEFVVKVEKPAEPLANLALLFEPAGGFSQTLATPDSEADNRQQWNLSGLTEDKEINIKGAFSPAEAVSDLLVKFKLVIWKDGDRRSEPYSLNEQTVNLAVLKTDLSVGLAINGSVSDFAVQPGEILNTSINLKNAGDRPLKNVIVRLIFETPSYRELSMLDWKELEDPADGQVVGEQVNAQIRRGHITWSKNQILDLRQLDPGEELLIDLRLPFKDAQDIDLVKFTSHLATAVAEMKYENSEGQKLLSSNRIQLTINSDFAFELRDKVSIIGSGQEARAITWFLSNTFHELQDIQLSADVYGDVSWAEEELAVPAGEVKYDHEKKKLVWQIEKMPTSVDVLALQFVLIINKQNPSQTNLMSKVTITAKDAITGQQIILAGEGILLKP